MKMCAHCGGPLRTQRANYCNAPDCQRAKNRRYMRRTTKDPGVRDHRKSVRRRREGVREWECAGGCGKSVRRSRSGEASICRDCLSRDWRLKPSSKGLRTKRQWVAQQKLDKAQRGATSGWVWTVGPCAWCGDSFTVRASGPARFCSKPCKDSAHTRGKVHPTVRAAVYERDGWICQLCSEPVDPAAQTQVDDWAPTLDHITPRSKGGSDEPDNLRLAHRWCNSARGDESWDISGLFTAA